MVEIIDEGPGNPPEQLPHLFEPYRSGREGGLGLGL
jgi:signal transduction histidine kinase